MYPSLPPWRDLVHGVLVAERGKVMDVADVLSAVRRRLELADYSVGEPELDACVREELEELAESGALLLESDGRWLLSGATW